MTDADFGPDPLIDPGRPDTDYLLSDPAPNAIATAARDAARESSRKRARGRRELYLSETVFRDGEPTEVHEVLWVEEDDDEIGDAELSPGRYEAPDRRTNPYGWEMFWRQVMRQGPPTGRWTAAPLRGVAALCELCGKPMDVRAKGRPRRYHEVCGLRAWRARNPVKRNAATK